MNVRAFLFALILAVSFAECGPVSSSLDSGVEQIVVASHPSGALEVGRASIISIDLLNNASSSPLENSSALSRKEGREALGIVAELQGRDGGITVLSGPQNAGSLGPGESRPVEFMIEAGDEAGIGIHPLELTLSYSVLSGIDATGEMSLPDLALHYREMGQAVPLEVRVALGPRIEVDGVRGNAVAGGTYDLEVDFVNRGDSKAKMLQVKLIPQEPFSCEDCAYEVEAEALSPGERSTARFRIVVEEVPKGEYALPLSVSYVHEGEGRVEEMAALVQVSDRSWINVAFIPTILLVLMLMASGIYLAIVARKRRPRQKRRIQA